MIIRNGFVVLKGKFDFNYNKKGFYNYTKAWTIAKYSSTKTPMETLK